MVDVKRFRKELKRGENEVVPMKHFYLAIDKLRRNRVAGSDGVKRGDLFNPGTTVLNAAGEALIAKAYAAANGGTWQHEPSKEARLRKKGKDAGYRTISVPTIAQQIFSAGVTGALLERHGWAARTAVSSGCLPGMSPKRAARRLRREIRELLTRGHAPVAIAADIKDCFGSVDKVRLIDKCRALIQEDPALLIHIESIITDAKVGNEEGVQPVNGLEQGSPASPALLNMYLRDVDNMLELSTRFSTRYVDDFRILCESNEEAEGGLDLLSRALESEGLRLSPRKTRIVDLLQEPLKFVGFELSLRKAREDDPPEYTADDWTVVSRPTSGNVKALLRGIRDVVTRRENARIPFGRLIRENVKGRIHAFASRYAECSHLHALADQLDPRIQGIVIKAWRSRYCSGPVPCCSRRLLLQELGLPTLRQLWGDSPNQPSGEKSGGQDIAENGETDSD